MKLTDRDTPPLTDEAVARCRDLIGIPLRRTPLNTTATAQSIKRWALGIGERNPLYLDPGYSSRSRFGSVVAPWLWLYSVDDTVVAPGLPGIHTLYTGVHWEFFHPVRAGTAIDADARMIDVTERESTFAGRMVTQHSEIVYSDTSGRTVARAAARVDRFARSEAVRRGVYQTIAKQQYTEADLLAIEDAYDAEVIRGDEVRYWEDTEVGEELPPVVKGPLTAEDIITFVCATSPLPTYDAQLRRRQRHPLTEFYDVDNGRYDAWERSLLEPDVANQFGFPLPHDTGHQRVAWLGNLLTNWAGDDAHLRDLSVDITRPNFYADTAYCRGSVVDKYVSKGVPLVRCAIGCWNQRGECTANGFAVVALQSRAVTAGEV